MQNDFSKLSLLYVEDDSLILQNAVEYLTPMFKEVYEAKDGQEALKIYKQKKPDIIISDIKMPLLNGLDMAKKIRLSDKKTPIIITTAHTQTDYLLEAVELQLIKYIVKPVTARKLQEALAIAYEAIFNTKNILQINEDTKYDLLNKSLVVNNELVKLTKKESLFIDLLVQNYQRVIDYQEIENNIWGDKGMSIDSLRSLISPLKHKLSMNFIQNISGVGYKCEVLL